MAALTQIIILSIFLNGVICDTNYRLNSRVIPSEYLLTITPYFESGDSPFTFDGEVTIKVTTAFESVNQIKLHSEDLEFDADNVTVRAGNVVVGLNTTNPVEFDKVYTFAYINLATELSVNTEYEINIVYKGPIRSDLNGFYRSSYVENGQTKWLGATQMEPVHARKAFPCFDEPEYKARFTLVIDRPEGFTTSLTNTKLENSTILNNGYIRERFRQTPIMSTYLVAFLVSEFQAGTSLEDGDREFGVWVRPEATNQTDFAFDFGKRVVAALSNYTGIDYYSVDSNLRLDHVGLPDFRAGAMENWGLIKYREALLLYVREESTPYYRYRVAQIVAHETTHMWFGNLVTCHWWSDTWLNEGFANYFQDYITAEVEPELESGDLLVTSSVYQAYSADEIATPAPITNENVNSPTEISTHFGTISYQKAGSVIRMVHHWVGDEAFRRGLYEHLNAARLSVAYPEDLYLGLQTGVSYTNSLSSYPGYTVASLMRPWITQAGHPVLKVELNRTSNEITLTQNRFYANSSLQSDELYPIPVTYSQESASNFIDTKPRFIMSSRTQSLSGNFSDEEWIIFNVQETGFYRVNYDDHLWSLIGDVLRGESRTAVHNLNRAKIVNDLFALAATEHVSYRLAFDVLEFLAAETDYSVWFAAVAGFNALRNKLLIASDAGELERFALRLLNTVIEDLGFDERDGDSFVTLRNRMQITEFACKLGHQACQDHAVSVFRNFRDNNVPVPTSLRPVVYCYGLQHGSAEDYDAMYQRKLTTNVANEALIIETALGCSTVPEKLESYLTQMVSSNSSLREQDVSVPLTSVLSHSENFRVAFTFLQENYAALRGFYTTISNILAYFPPAITKEEDLEEFAEWLSCCAVCTAEETEAARTGAAAARESLAWTRAHAVDIVQPLREKNRAATLLPPLAGLLFSIFLVQIVM